MSSRASASSATCSGTAPSLSPSASAADADPATVLRVIAAATRAGAPVSVVSAVPLPHALAGVLDDLGSPTGSRQRPVLTGRVRLVGGSASELLEAAGGDPDLASGRAR